MLTSKLAALLGLVTLASSSIIRRQAIEDNSDQYVFPIGSRKCIWDVQLTYSRILSWEFLFSHACSVIIGRVDGVGVHVAPVGSAKAHVEILNGRSSSIVVLR